MVYIVGGGGGDGGGIKLSPIQLLDIPRAFYLKIDQESLISSESK